MRIAIAMTQVRPEDWLHSLQDALRPNEHIRAAAAKECRQSSAPRIVIQAGQR